MRRFTALAFSFILLALAAGRPGAAETTQLLNLSLPRISLRENESVHSIRCRLVGGRIVGVPHLPGMWTFTITNGDGEVSTLDAHALVGAAELRTVDLGFFKEFLVISRPNPPGKWDRPFTIKVSLRLVSSTSGAPTRTLTFGESMLVLSAER